MSRQESARLAVLRQLNLLDTPPTESFDRITRIASQLFGLPIAAVSLTDENRQWFKSRVGLDRTEFPRQMACCSKVAETSDVVIITDLLESPEFRSSPLAESGIRFYAGAPLTTHDGYTLGAMCVLGKEPRQATDEEIQILKDLASMVMTQIEIQHAVGRVDANTGLPNFYKFSEDLAEIAAEQTGATKYALSTELIDLSQANSMQRVMGPAYLDDISRAAAEHLYEALDDSTKLYHVGPCQFAHIEEGDEDEIIERAQCLQKHLNSFKLGAASPFMVRPVIGVAPFKLGDKTAAPAVRMAHSACRDARDEHRKVGVYSRASDARHLRRFSLIEKFTEALESADQLRLVYQPRISMTSGQCDGAEALIRWHHSLLGDVSPAEFIPLIENTPLARVLTDWVLRHAIRQAATWHRKGSHIRVSINIAAANLEEQDFAERVLNYLNDNKLAVTAIELELTESGLIGNGESARQQLDTLMRVGVKVAIDDFGTGYSTMAYLQKIPADVVKIDRSFTNDLENQSRNQALVKSMVSIAHDLGYSVVAEGVESWASYRFLEALGCDEVQGYLIAKPLDRDPFEQWLRDLASSGNSILSAQVADTPARVQVRRNNPA